MASKIAVAMPVRINEDWQLPMTKCAIDTLRHTTEVDFDLCVVEANGNHCEGMDGIDQYKQSSISPNHDANVAFDLCSALGADFIVYTANDVFVRPNWLECLLECFQKPHCGCATLMAAELEGRLAFDRIATIGEGYYGPFMMFPSRWRFDADDFPHSFGDTDLVLRIYDAGLRSYRNFNSTLFHMVHSTLGADPNFKVAAQRFYNKHKDNPSLMFQLMVTGKIF